MILSGSFRARQSQRDPLVSHGQPLANKASSLPEQRAAHEIAHGRRIVERAEQYWGWASPAGRVRVARRARMLVEHAGVTAGTHVLEAGCGTGLFTVELASTGANVDAVDISPALLEKAQERPGCEHVRFLLGNIETGESLGGSYDAVVGISVLHHLDATRALPKLIAVLKPGGRFVFTEPNLRNPQVWLQKNVGWIKRRLGDSPDETAFVRGQLAAALRGYGLADVSVTPFEWLHPWTPRVFIPSVRALGSLLEKIPVVREFGGSLLVVATKPV